MTFGLFFCSSRTFNKQVFSICSHLTSSSRQAVHILGVEVKRCCNYLIYFFGSSLLSFRFLRLLSFSVLFVLLFSSFSSFSLGIFLSYSLSSLIHNLTLTPLLFSFFSYSLPFHTRRLLLSSLILFLFPLFAYSFPL